MTQDNDFDNMDRLSDLTQRLKVLISFETQGPLLSELTEEIRSLSDSYNLLLSQIDSDLLREIVILLRGYLRQRDPETVSGLKLWIDTKERLRVIVDSLDPQSE